MYIMYILQEKLQNEWPKPLASPHNSSTPGPAFSGLSRALKGFAGQNQGLELFPLTQNDLQRADDLQRDWTM